MNSVNIQPAEVALVALFDALALTLIPLDITPSRLAQIVRNSFVKAEASKARVRSSGRPHLAKIAAATGLSRTEVKRIVSSQYRIGRAQLADLPRALRVLAAWRSTSPYSRNGRPLSLKISGKAPSFESLCKEHSGDIPHRVILNELISRKCINVSGRHQKASIANNSHQRSGLQRELSALSFIASFIADSTNPDRVLIRRREKVLVSPETPDSYVENAIAARVSQLLDTVPTLFITSNTQARRRASVNVFALVSRAKRPS